MPETILVCKHCQKKVDDPAEFWADEFCQDCWENYCNDEWQRYFGGVPWGNL